MKKNKRILKYMSWIYLGITSTIGTLFLLFLGIAKLIDWDFITF